MAANKQCLVVITGNLCGKCHSYINSTESKIKSYIQNRGDMMYERIVCNGKIGVKESIMPDGSVVDLRTVLGYPFDNRVSGGGSYNYPTFVVYEYNPLLVSDYTVSNSFNLKGGTTTSLKYSDIISVVETVVGPSPSSSSVPSPSLASSSSSPSSSLSIAKKDVKKPQVEEIEEVTVRLSVKGNKVSKIKQTSDGRLIVKQVPSSQVYQTKGGDYLPIGYGLIDGTSPNGNKQVTKYKTIKQ